ncbi:hypothetical protein NQ315_013206 [Exocentrus adspersus]|uniref:C2H2-type domain-containing protein n=1 Tax=Exocentrus adspersus TaxID=1586481 RepID=A0AAV8VDL7_9CUCU|nr:hypothetical protein NQ315_013206 [Exocentrus adspersus]
MSLQPVTEPIFWIRKYSHTKKKFTKQSQLEAASESNFDINQDGSTTSEGELLGWNTYPWTCCDCQITFPVSDDLKAHYSSVHNSPSRYLCADCPKVYSKYNTFLLHVKLHRIKLKLCCDVCYKWFPSEAAQEQHRSHHGDDRPHACNTCEKRFTMQSALMV